MLFSWLGFRTNLYRLANESLVDLAKEIGDEELCGFAFDCNADYGQIFFAANTTEYMRFWAQEKVENPPELTRLPELEEMIRQYSDKPLDTHIVRSFDEWVQRVQWSTGDWKYPQMNTFESLKIWSTYESAVSEWNMFCGGVFSGYMKFRFMNAACRVMRKLAQNGVFNQFKLAPAFDVFVSDHDECDEDAWKRLRRFIGPQSIAHNNAINRSRGTGRL